MTKASSEPRTAACRCGHVRIETEGRPILAVICYCESCQRAGSAFGALPGASPILQHDGGTGFVVQRKDRVRFPSGADALREHRLSPASGTRRVLASCCNTPMFLEFAAGHWLSLYGDRLPADARPRPEMRVMTRDRRAGVEFDDDLPSYAKHNVKFMWRLLGAWVAMGFKSPSVPVGGAIDA